MGFFQEKLIEMSNVWARPRSRPRFVAIVIATSGVEPVFVLVSVHAADQHVLYGRRE